MCDPASDIRHEIYPLICLCFLIPFSSYRRNLIYNYNMSVRACVRPTRQFRVLMMRRNRPGRSDSENGNRPDQSVTENGRPDRAGRGRGAGQGHPRARAGKNGVLENGVRENGRPGRAGQGAGGRAGRGRGQGKAGRAGAK
jgi:hypothetical protein